MSGMEYPVSLPVEQRLGLLQHLRVRLFFRHVLREARRVRVDLVRGSRMFSLIPAGAAAEICGCGVMAEGKAEEVETVVRGWNAPLIGGRGERRDDEGEEMSVCKI